jgi:hypothetical protein
MGLCLLECNRCTRKRSVVLVDVHQWKFFLKDSWKTHIRLTKNSCYTVIIVEKHVRLIEKSC